MSAAVLAQEAGPEPFLPDEPFDYLTYAVTNLPEHYLPSPPFGDAGASNNTPADNPISNDGATLGRVLFYDKRLSINHTISCASCHTQETGFADVRQLSVGHDGSLTHRHSMGLTNAVFYASGRFRWDESAETLEIQTLIPIEAENEMGLPLATLRDRLAGTPFYQRLFVNAFGDASVTDERIAKALAQFVRSMVSYHSKYDLGFEMGEFGFPDFEAVFDDSELLGQQLFERTSISVKCHECHASAAQIGGEPRNIGLDLINTDEGAGSGRFKVPALRNIAVRGRFMHDGRFQSLAEVVQFYDSEVQDNPDLDGLLRVDGDPDGKPERLNLSRRERQALVDFMGTLTDHQFLNDPKFSDPFQKPAVLSGDVNLDGSVNKKDIPAFVDRVIRATYQFEADLNLDGVVNLRDVQPFVNILNNG